MTPDEQGQQLELFKLAGDTPPRPHREMLGRVMLHFRTDQLVLGSIGGLIGIAIIFAFGVERGKLLVRGERMILSRQQPAAPKPSAAEPKPSAAAPKPSGVEPVAAAPKVSKPVKAEQKSPTASPKAKPRPKVASADAKSRYAIQVVTYTQPKLAKKELERLQARGEQAFLVMREGRTIVYVGPFPSKDNASAKLSNLRSRYQDCFMRTL